jgi:hypothetical protein
MKTGGCWKISQTQCFVRVAFFTTIIHLLNGLFFFFPVIFLEVYKVYPLATAHGLKN